MDAKESLLSGALQGVTLVSSMLAWCVFFHMTQANECVTAPKAFSALDAQWKQNVILSILAFMYFNQLASVKSTGGIGLAIVDPDVHMGTRDVSYGICEDAKAKMSVHIPSPWNQQMCVLTTVTHVTHEHNCGGTSLLSSRSVHVHKP